MSGSRRILVINSDEDRDDVIEFLRHLSLAEQQEQVRIDAFARSLPGESVEAWIESALAHNDAALLILSPAFFSDDRIQKSILPRLLERVGNDLSLLLLPLRPCLWNHHRHLAGRTAFLPEGKFLSTLSPTQRQNVSLKIAEQLIAGGVSRPQSLSQSRVPSPQQSKDSSWKKLKPMVLGAIIFDWSRRVFETVSQSIPAAFGKVVVFGTLGSAVAVTGVLTLVNQHEGPPDLGSNRGPKYGSHSEPGQATRPPPSMDHRDLAVSDLSRPEGDGPDEPVPDLAKTSYHTSGHRYEPSSAPLDLAVPFDLTVPPDLTSQVDLLTAARTAEVFTEFYRKPPPPWLPMVAIPEEGANSAGTNEMRHSSQPVHIRYKFWMARTEVTQRQYQQVFNQANPSYFNKPGKDDLPVENISWLDAILFCNALSRNQHLPVCYDITPTEVKWLHGLDCPGFRLPTENEWLHAARAGQSEEYAGGSVPDQVAWYLDNAGYQTHPVGRKSHNAWLVYDMSGNVSEWVWDKYLPEPRNDINYVATLDLGSRVIRGGSYYDNIKRINLTRRQGERPHYKSSQLGLRIVRTVR